MAIEEKVMELSASSSASRRGSQARKSFVDDLKADSLDVVELVMEFEDEFELTIPDEDYEKIRTVGDAIKYIEQQRSSRRR